MKTPNNDTQPSGRSSQQRFVRHQEIDPKINPAFSPNLHKWLKKNHAKYKEIDRWEHDGVDYIGWSDEEGWFYGSRLWGVLTNGGRERTWACPFGKGEAKSKPLWEDYLKVGRCAIDADHRSGFLGNRWHEGSHGRTCLWCGLRQKKETYTHVEKREKWVSLPNATKSISES